MAGNFVHNDTNPQATIGREDRPWYAMYADDVYATDYHGDIEGTTGINPDVQDALDLKAPLASPALTGTPTAPTAATGTTTTQLATTAFVANAIASGGGTGTRCLFFGLMSACPTQSLTGFDTWLSQGSCSVIESSAGLSIRCPAGSGGSLLKSSLPSTPYAITFLLLGCTITASSYPGFSVAWRDSSTGKRQRLTLQYNEYWNYYQLQVDNCTASAWAATVMSVRSPFADNVMWCRLKDDGTTVYFEVSADGANFVSLYSVTKSSGYLGSSGYNQMTLEIASASTYETIVTMASYAQT